AVCRTLQDRASAGKVFELAGPEAMALREVIERILAGMQRRAVFLPIPFPIAGLLARFAQLLPGAPLTVAQVELLERDNVPAPGVPGLGELGIPPRRIEEAIAALASRQGA